MTRSGRKISTTSPKANRSRKKNLRLKYCRYLISIVKKEAIFKKKLTLKEDETEVFMHDMAISLKKVSLYLRARAKIEI